MTTEPMAYRLTNHCSFCHIPTVEEHADFGFLSNSATHHECQDMFHKQAEIAALEQAWLPSSVDLEFTNQPRGRHSLPLEQDIASCGAVRTNRTSASASKPRSQDVPSNPRVSSSFFSRRPEQRASFKNHPNAQQKGIDGDAKELRGTAVGSTKGPPPGWPLLSLFLHAVVA